MLPAAAAYDVVLREILASLLEDYLVDVASAPQFNSFMHLDYCSYKFVGGLDV